MGRGLRATSSPYAERLTTQPLAWSPKAQGGCPSANVPWCTVGHPRALDETRTFSRAIAPAVSRVTSGESTASLLAVAGRIAGEDASLFNAFSCSWTPPPTFYKLLEIERLLPLNFAVFVAGQSGQGTSQNRLFWPCSRWSGLAPRAR